MRTSIVAAALATCFLLECPGAYLQGQTSNVVRPVLWRDPGDIASQDLFWGAGSPDVAPLPPFTFVKEDLGGTKPKIHITDARGVSWSVKFSGDKASQNEVHAEVAASRLIWSLGYLVEESYYVHEGTVDDVTGLKRAAAHIDEGGKFRTARFEKRPDRVVRTGRSWRFDQNPFMQSRELSGLKILTTMLCNWDAGGDNTEILRVTQPDRLEDWYVVSDLGSTFGEMGLPGSFSKHTRWVLDDYRRERVLDVASRDVIRLHYQGSAAIRDVPTAHARWFVEMLTQLRREQIAQAFKAGGASDDEVDGFTSAFIEKIAQLQQAVSNVE